MQRVHMCGSSAAHAQHSTGTAPSLPSQKSDVCAAETCPGHCLLLDPPQWVLTRAGCIPAAREPSTEPLAAPGPTGQPAEPCPSPTSHPEPASLAQVWGEAMVSAASLYHHPGFTAQLLLFKDSRSELQWGLRKELCVEAANL